MRGAGLLLVTLLLSGSIVMVPGAPAALETTAIAAREPAAAADAIPCAPPVVQARVVERYVALRWTECASAAEYVVLRGLAPDALAPLVTVDHPSHIDVGAPPASEVYYAVQARDATSALLVVGTLGGPNSS